MLIITDEDKKKEILPENEKESATRVEKVG